MSDYKARMKAWAVDRVISIAGVTESAITTEYVIKEADKLSAYAYSPAEDFSDACGRITEILKESPDAIDKCDLLIAELETIKSDIQRQIGMAKAATHGAAHA